MLRLIAGCWGTLGVLVEVLLEKREREREAKQKKRRRGSSTLTLRIDSSAAVSLSTSCTAPCHGFGAAEDAELAVQRAHSGDCPLTDYLAPCSPARTTTTPGKHTRTPTAPTTMSQTLWPNTLRCPRGPRSTVSYLGGISILDVKLTPAAYETGSSALLLQLSGTLPVTYRGTVYKFPIALWIPNTYPREPPIAYVIPTQDMAVRVGQHVTLEGRVYHHYMAHWAGAWEVSIVRNGFVWHR